MRVLIDTNVVLDFFLARQPQMEHADKLFKLVYGEKIEAYTTASAITDIYYVVKRTLGENSARAAIIQLLKMLGVIAVDGYDCFVALGIPISDYEDALVVTCSEKEAVDYIVTNDSDFIKADTVFAKVLAPKEFLGLSGE